jgi:3-oxoacyl-[acyl-carrier protein] reductase
MELPSIRAAITGAASGLGREFALQCLRGGASVYAGDINASGLRQLKRDGASLPGTLFVQAVDVTDELGITEFFRQAESELKGMNTVINSAGILADGLLVGEVEGGGIRTMNRSQWTRVLDVNLGGSFHVTREAAGIMAAHKRPGIIINISSISRSGNAGQSNYSASKAGIDAATRSWAKELGPLGIRVAAIAPGVVDTPMLSHISPEALDGLLSRIALRRFGNPCDIWRAVRFIIECDYFTGRVLEVDGGADLAWAL